MALRGGTVRGPERDGLIPRYGTSRPEGGDTGRRGHGNNESILIDESGGTDGSPIDESGGTGGSLIDESGGTGGSSSLNRVDGGNLGNEDNATMTACERDDPGHQALWRNFHPAAATCGGILHYALP
jgi:hypothetical protein